MSNATLIKSEEKSPTRDKKYDIGYLDYVINSNGVAKLPIISKRPCKRRIAGD